MLLLILLILVLYLIFCLYMFRKFEKSENFMIDFDILLKVSKAIKFVAGVLVVIHTCCQIHYYLNVSVEDSVAYADIFKHFNEAVRKCMNDKNFTYFDCSHRPRQGVVPHYFLNHKAPSFISDKDHIKEFAQLTQHHVYFKDDHVMFFTRWAEQKSSNIFGIEVRNVTTQAKYINTLIGNTSITGRRSDQYVVIPAYKDIWDYIFNSEGINAGVENFNNNLNEVSKKNVIKDIDEIKRMSDEYMNKLCSEIIRAKNNGEVFDFGEYIKNCKNKKK